MTSVLIAVLGLGHAVVLVAWELATAGEEGQRPSLVVRIRPRARRRGRCGRCGAVTPWFDQVGGEGRWRHIDLGFATCELIGDARRVACPTHGPTVAAARRHGVSWRAVVCDHLCVRVARETLGRVDLLEGSVAVAIDQVKYKKGQRYLIVTWNYTVGLNGSPFHELRGRLRFVDWSGGEVAGVRLARASGGVAGDLGGPGPGAEDDRCLCRWAW